MSKEEYISLVIEFSSDRILTNVNCKYKSGYIPKTCLREIEKISAISIDNYLLFVKQTVNEVISSCFRHYEFSNSESYYKKKFNNLIHENFRSLKPGYACNLKVLGEPNATL